MLAPLQEKNVRRKEACFAAAPTHRAAYCQAASLVKPRQRVAALLQPRLVSTSSITAGADAAKAKNRATKNGADGRRDCVTAAATERAAAKASIILWFTFIFIAASRRTFFLLGMVRGAWARGEEAWRSVAIIQATEQTFSQRLSRKMA
jgi:hypothetical protein